MIEAFAVEDTAVQLHWAGLSAGDHVVAVGDEVRVVDASVGAVSIEGLAAETTYPIVLDGAVVGRARTLARPRGPLLTRVATISDLHIGEGGFGFLPRIPSDGRHGIRATRAALDEALAWGAELIVVKGDIAHHGWHAEYDELDKLLATVDVDVLVLAGNHDGGDHVHSNFTTLRRGQLVTDVTVRDVAGARLIGVDSVRPGHKRGRVIRVLDQVVAAASCTDGPVLVMLHHPPERTLVRTHPPAGLLGVEAWLFLERLHRANAQAFVTAGHSHRHRRRRHRSITITEVGSVKDHPGTWAGYALHAGGIRQVVRRIAEPEVIEWTQRTGRTVGGLWGRYSPGRLIDRCFVVNWP